MDLVPASVLTTIHSRMMPNNTCKKTPYIINKMPGGPNDANRHYLPKRVMQAAKLSTSARFVDTKKLSAMLEHWQVS